MNLTDLENKVADVTARVADSDAMVKARELKDKVNNSNAANKARETLHNVECKAGQVKDKMTNAANNFRDRVNAAENKEAGENKKVSDTLKGMAKKSLDYSAKAAEYVAEKAHEASGKL